MGYQFALARYDIEGNLDGGFHGDGKVLIDFAVTRGARLAGIAIDGVDRIVGAGSGDGRFALARCMPDGTLDASFGDHGRVVTDVPGMHLEYISAVALDSEGRIVVGGAGLVGEDRRCVVARYEADGTLDPTFNRTGIAIADFRSCAAEQFTSLTVDDDDKVVAGGYALVVGSGDQFALARFCTDGRLDERFDRDGKVLTDFRSSANERVHAVTIDSRGRIVAAGEALIPDSGHQFAVARYTSRGDLDDTFERDGKVLTPFFVTSGTESDAIGYAVGCDSRDRVVVGGGAGGQFALARYNEDGTLDAGFGDGGRVRTDLRSAASEHITALVIDRSNFVTVCGEADGKFALARYDTAGRLHERFGGDGKVITDFRSAWVEGATAIAIDVAGNFVVGGWARI
jgi:uncharacterized delta-60 repeat protein